eukprot:10486251-Lingulodinium_polyedra.AAC.1
MSKAFCKLREVLCKLIADSQLSGPELLEFIKKKAELLLTLDSTASLEIAILEGMLGAGGKKLAEDRLLACLPSARAGYTLAQSQQM